MVPAEHWARSLAEWAIPGEILKYAEEDPWIHPPELFEIPDEIDANVSHTRALEALPLHGSVLDIGCGGGIAAFALVPKASLVIGVDHQPAMLEMFTETAKKLGVLSQVFEGFWPQVAPEVPIADVVVSHHVVYNVAQIVPFLQALTAHARNRVVIEMPTEHPLSNMTDAWKFFWNLERPSEPNSEDLMHVLAGMGIKAEVEKWMGGLRDRVDLDQDSEFMRIRLCLPAERLPEVREFLIANPQPRTREIATIWWDVNA